MGSRPLIFFLIGASDLLICSLSHHRISYKDRDDWRGHFLSPKLTT